MTKMNLYFMLFSCIASVLANRMNISMWIPNEDGLNENRIEYENVCDDSQCMNILMEL